MKLATNCKFCKKPITLTIDDNYDAIGDPLKLLPLASCNHCADLRVARRSLEKKLSVICNEMIFSSKKADAASKERSRTALTHWTKEYSKLIARWNNSEGMLWDEEVVNQMLEHPETCNEVLSRLWTMFNQWHRAEKEKQFL